MRLGEKSRNPLLEGAVFGLALLLVVILVFYGFRRFLARRPPSPPAAGGGMVIEAKPSQAASASATETVVSSIPPIRLSRVGRPRTWRMDVPAPAGKKKD
jgi:hypothetical protein